MTYATLCVQVRLTFSGRGPTLHLPPPYSIVIQVVNLNNMDKIYTMLLRHQIMHGDKLNTIHVM
jgi:hypothetical protein